MELYQVVQMAVSMEFWTDEISVVQMVSEMADLMADEMVSDSVELMEHHSVVEMVDYWALI